MISPIDVIEIHKAIAPAEGLAILETDEVKAAVHPDVTPEILDELSKVPNEFIQALVAANPAASPETLAVLSKSRNPVILSYVIVNDNTPVEVLSSIAVFAERHPSIAINLANNPKTPWDSLYRIINQNDQDPFVAFSAMANPNVPSAILSTWAEEGDLLKSRAVAVNRNTMSETLELLYTKYGETDPLIADGIAGNPNTPMNVLVEIATKALTESIGQRVTDQDRMSTIRRAAIQSFLNPNFPHDKVPVPMSEKDRVFRVNLVHGKNLPDSVWYQLTQDKTLHLSIVSRTNLPQGVLNILLESDDPAIRFKAANHPSLSPEFVNTLIYRMDSHVRAGSVYQIAHGHDDYSVSRRWAMSAASDDSVIVRESVAHRRDLADEVYLALSKDPDHSVRKAALETIRDTNRWDILPDEAVIGLACDPNPDVRSIAKLYFLGERRR